MGRKKLPENIRRRRVQLYLTPEEKALILVFLSKLQAAKAEVKTAELEARPHPEGPESLSEMVSAPTEPDTWREYL